MWRKLDENNVKILIKTIFTTFSESVRIHSFTFVYTDSNQLGKLLTNLLKLEFKLFLVIILIFTYIHNYMQFFYILDMSHDKRNIEKLGLVC